MYGFNKYVANGEVRVEECDFDGIKIRTVSCFGTALYDRRNADFPEVINIPSHQAGRPHEMVLHVAGLTYYPTPNGYVVF